MTATATVVADPGPAQGDVVFSVDGLANKANLGASGTAHAGAPGGRWSAQHAVSATYVPHSRRASQGEHVADPVVDGGRTVADPAPGAGHRARAPAIPTSVQVRAAGDYGTRPTGRVKVVVAPDRHPGSTRVVDRASSGAAARAGRPRPTAHRGRYRLVVTYVGDSQHLRERVSREVPASGALTARHDRDSVTVSDPTRMRHSVCG